MASPPDPAFQALFDHARAQVTEADIRAHSPNDPGVLGYVRAWSQVRRQGKMPGPGKFDIEEPIRLSAGSVPARDPAGFRRYRVLLDSVALPWSLRGSLDGWAPNAILARLLDDAAALADRRLLDLLGPALRAAHEQLREQTDAELPFTSLALWILHHLRPLAGADADALARQVLDEEHAARERGDAHGREFLWGLTYYDLQRPVWQRLIARCMPDDPRPGTAIAALRDALSLSR